MPKISICHLRGYKISICHVRGYMAQVLFKGGSYGTALQAALYWGHIEVIQLLVEKGADVKAKD
ncbi:hypothetical protein B0H16DRAFT_1637502 [Mycena metata]|uniref:Ankyrin repeat protein n=1 Tax=Mycena metata TaxID=1033252 RepID=A0AAD7GT79_9AGAR|nr:hypothetical protein B0H16DRAFT_1637502 [Mycena metata]